MQVTTKIMFVDTTVCGSLAGCVYPFVCQPHHYSHYTKTGRKSSALLRNIQLFNSEVSEAQRYWVWPLLFYLMRLASSRYLSRTQQLHHHCDLGRCPHSSHNNAASPRWKINTPLRLELKVCVCVEWERRPCVNKHACAPNRPCSYGCSSLQVFYEAPWNG